MTVLVTGGAGFIGSHFIERLLAQERDTRVVCLDNFSPSYDPAARRASASRLAAIERVEVVEGSICDHDLCSRVLAQHDVSAIVHLAGLAGVRTSVAQPLEYLEANVRGTLVLLEAARAARQFGLRFLAGVEISCAFPRPGTLHMLAYGVDVRHRGLRAIIRGLDDAREERIRLMMDRLRALGVEVTWDDLRDANGEIPASIGRPHLAAAMVRRGHVLTTRQAFDRYLGGGGLAYVDTHRVSPERAQASGVPARHRVRLLRAADAVHPIADLRNATRDGLQPLHVADLLDGRCRWRRRHWGWRRRGHRRRGGWQRGRGDAVRGRHAVSACRVLDGERIRRSGDQHHDSYEHLCDHSSNS